jgi:peptide/nickel transport system ATP-binding protein
MYLGRVVEIGETQEIFADPKHPYTKALLKAIPEPDPSISVPRDLPRGEIPDAAEPPLGCSFHPRCPVAFEICGWESRDLRARLEEHWLAVDPAEYDRERQLFANLDDVDIPSKSVTLNPARPATANQLAEVLENVRRTSSDDPTWRGLDSMETTDQGVTVTFRNGEDPALRPSGEVEVACHLY